GLDSDAQGQDLTAAEADLAQLRDVLNHDPLALWQGDRVDNSRIGRLRDRAAAAASAAGKLAALRDNASARITPPSAAASPPPPARTRSPPATGPSPRSLSWPCPRRRTPVASPPGSRTPNRSRRPAAGPGLPRNWTCSRSRPRRR